MSQTDTIADCLTRIRNALKAHHHSVDMRKSNLNYSILKVLLKHGFIKHILVYDDAQADKASIPTAGKKVKNVECKKGKMRVFLKYVDDNGEPVIHGLKRVSSPGLRRYIPSTEIPTIRKGMGISILSTSKGVMDGSAARRENVGGELLCYVW